MEHTIVDHIRHLECKNRSERRTYIEKTLSELGYTYREHSFRSRLTRGTNIIVDIFDPTDTSPCILLSAHYDAALGSPGANDNASGVAVLLNLLEKLKGLTHHPMRIIFFDLEEKLPLTCGAKAYVRDFGTADISFLINLEMVGIGDTAMIWTDESQRNNPEIRALQDAFKASSTETMFAKTAMPIAPFLYPRLTSDHEPFTRHGFMKAYSITMIPREDVAFNHVVQNKKFFRFIWSAARYYLLGTGDYPKILRHYHTKADCLKHIDPRTLQIVSEVLLKIVRV